MRPTLMTARTALIPPLVAIAAVFLAAACGGDGEEAPPPAGLTDPGTVPTATPWAEAPQPIILDPEALTPSGEENGDDQPANGEDGDGGDGDGVEVTPVVPFEVTSEESTNLRAGPSTDEPVLSTLTEGEAVTVTGQTAGEAVSEGNDIWYQLEDGSFVYSGAVQRVEEEDG